MQLDEIKKNRKIFLDFYKRERNTNAYKDDKSYALMIENKIKELEK